MPEGGGGGAEATGVGAAADLDRSTGARRRVRPEAARRPARAAFHAARSATPRRNRGTAEKSRLRFIAPASGHDRRRHRADRARVGDGLGGRGGRPGGGCSVEQALRGRKQVGRGGDRRRDLREASALAERDRVQRHQPPADRQLLVVGRHEPLQATEEIGEVEEVPLEGEGEGLDREASGPDRRARRQRSRPSRRSKRPCWMVDAGVLAPVDAGVLVPLPVAGLAGAAGAGVGAVLPDAPALKVRLWKSTPVDLGRRLKLVDQRRRVVVRRDGLAEPDQRRCSCWRTRALAAFPAASWRAHCSAATAPRRSACAASPPDHAWAGSPAARAPGLPPRARRSTITARSRALIWRLPWSC